jgi:hypothetical protein
MKPTNTFAMPSNIILPGGQHLLRAVQSWMMANPTKTSTVPVGCSNLLKHHAIKDNLDQTAIGWENMFQGFISLSWGYIHYEKLMVPKTSEEKELHIKTVTAIRCYTNPIWGARNDILHSDTTKTTAIVQLRVNTTIYQIYADKDTFKDADRHPYKQNTAGSPLG